MGTGSQRAEENGSVEDGARGSTEGLDVGVGEREEEGLQMGLEELGRCGVSWSGERRGETDLGTGKFKSFAVVILKEMHFRC